MHIKLSWQNNAYLGVVELENLQPILFTLTTASKIETKAASGIAVSFDFFTGISLGAG